MVNRFSYQRSGLPQFVLEISLLRSKEDIPVGQLHQSTSQSFKYFLNGIINIILQNISYRTLKVKIKHAAAYALLFTFFKQWKGEKFLWCGGTAGKVLLVSAKALSKRGQRGLKHESSGFYFERMKSFRKSKIFVLFSQLRTVRFYARYRVFSLCLLILLARKQS